MEINFRINENFDEALIGDLLIVNYSVRRLRAWLYLWPLLLHIDEEYRLFLCSLLSQRLQKI